MLIALYFCAVAAPAAEHRWYSVPIIVSNLPPKSLAVPVSCSVNFSEALSSIQVQGLVDEQSLRLFRVNPDGSREQQSVQFAPDRQPRVKHLKLAPGTSTNVSFVAEIPAGEVPGGARSAGQITWLACADEAGAASYILVFGVPTSGSMVQVPYEPNNFRAFDRDGKSTPAVHFPLMQLRPQWPAEGAVDVLEGNQLVAAYHTGPTLENLKSAVPRYRRPFIYPLIGPDGVGLTGFGKPHDPTGSHRHHYSLWIAHNSVNGEDFWSEQGGVILHEGFENLEDGPLYCRITQKNLWHKETDNLRERRTTTFFASSQNYRLIDIDLELTSSRGSATTFGKTSFGFLAARVAQSMSATTFGKTSFGFLAARVAQSMSPFDGGGEIVNSAGDRNEQRAHLRRAHWLDQSGPVTPDRWGGVAMLEHPDNPRAPTGWHCRNDGWAGAAFNMDEPFTLSAGQPLLLRYRIVLHRWDAVRGDVPRRYEEYAAKPVIRVLAAKESPPPN